MSAMSLLCVCGVCCMWGGILVVSAAGGWELLW